MAEARARLVFSQLCGPAGNVFEDLSDGQLLELFITRHDEAAFCSLLHRHGGMVLHVCRRVLQQPQDAEDAFQGTFLLLAEKATSIQKRGSVASWLYGVAYRLALKSRARISRRRAREKRAVDMPAKEAGVQAAWEELHTILDEELQALPPKHQAPLVLCYLEGKTQEEAARQLGCPLGTIRSRVARAREMLKKRLARRGLALPAATLATGLATKEASAVPMRLLRSTATAALAHAAGEAIPAGLITTEAAALAKGGLKAMTATHLKLVAALVLALGLVAAGTAAVLSQMPSQPAPVTKPDSPPGPPSPA